jgi:hypothetical protein
MGAVKEDVLVMPITQKGISGMKSSTLQLLEKLKYDVLDIHYIYSFFNKKMIIGGVETTSMNSLTDIAN